MVTPAVLVTPSPAAMGHDSAPAQATPASIAPSVRSSVSSTGCTSGGHGAVSSTAGTSGALASPGSNPRPPAPDLAAGTALFNSQVTPYAVLTGPYAYIAKGAALRDQGYGKINLTWPGAPSTSNLEAAYMIWSEIDNSLPPSYGTLNGVNVSGTWSAFATPSPCWDQTYIYTFIADVTPDVVNGVNTLTNFPSTITNGMDPWSEDEDGILDEGVALVAIYDTHSSTDQQIKVYSGALTTTGQTLDAQLNYSTTNRTNATTTYMVADGQLPGNNAEWNGTVIDTDAFPGTDPKESTYTWSEGNLSDTRTFAVNVTLGSNNTTAAIFPTEGDCLTWVGQVVEVGVKAPRPPYTVTFQEQGLLNGAKWKVTTNGTTHTGTVSGGTSSLEFKLLNGTYSYSITPVAGYTASSLSGTYMVSGGPVFLRILFHQIFYPISFNETGLPAAAEWQVTLTNSSQGLDDQLWAAAPTNITFSEPNGTYNFTDSVSDLYLPTPTNGTFTVHGTAVVELIAFRPPPLFNVTFQENGLRAGLLWGAFVSSYEWGDFQNSTNDRSYTLPLPNASLDQDYAFGDSIPGYASPSYVYFGVFGAPETIQLNYSPLYPVYLNETGLPTGTSWSASLSGPGGDFYVGSTNGTIQFAAPNGTYTFDVSPVWSYLATPATGPIVVNGGFASQSIVFSLAPTYNVTFNETGLPVGTHWSVTVGLPNSHDQVVNSTGTNLTFQEPNSTEYYSFLVESSAKYFATPSTGDFYVAGKPLYEEISFAPEYAVNFTEQGLPSGTAWYVYFDGSYNSSHSNTTGFFAPDGSYYFYVYSVLSFSPTPSSGYVTVDGSAQTVPVTFASESEPTYSATFTESGLPSDTNWSVSLSGYLEWTTGATLTFTEPNGSFPFTAGGGTGYVASPHSGTLKVSGGPAHQAIAFSLPASDFLVTFTESSLPTGATWYVNITGQPPLETTVGATSGQSVAISLPNATYTFSAATSNRSWTTSAGGQFTVQGAVLSENVAFSSVSSSATKYLVTFTESSLPMGATWYVNITGEPGLSATVGAESGQSVSISLPNATYSFSAATSDKPWTTSAGGPLTVNGAALSEGVAFTSVGPSPMTYVVTFVEQNLPVGATWYVNITGQPGLSATVSVSSGTEVTVSLGNASYTYSAASGAQNWTAKGGSFTVSGAAQQLTVSFSDSGSTGSSASASLLPAGALLWLGGGLVAALLLFLILFAVWRRRKKEPKKDETSSPAASGSGPGGSSPPAG